MSHNLAIALGDGASRKALVDNRLSTGMAVGTALLASAMGMYRGSDDRQKGFIF